MIHLLDELVDAVTHGLELVAQLLVFVLEISLFAVIIGHTFDNSRRTLHPG